jgi:hypothetical protein
MRVVAIAILIWLLAQANLTAASLQRGLNDIPGARESLSRMVSPKFYRSLLISPVNGWIVVRGNLLGGRLSGTRVVHSELGGAYDRLALDLANNLLVAGFIRSEITQAAPPILVHVLIYEIADGRLALSFAHLDGSGGSQMRCYGSAWMAVEKPNHLWVTIEPRQLARGERRGPRMYTLAIENPQAKTTLPRGVGAPLMRTR